MHKKLVIIPTYNEIENIEGMARSILSLKEGFELLVVDDGSPDGTAEAVRKLETEFGGRLHLEERRGKLGLGTAYIHGFKWALARDYDYIFEMDCDFSHDPADLRRGKHHVAGLGVREELERRCPVRQVQLLRGTTHQVLEVLPLETSPDRGPDEAAMAGDIEASVAIEPAWVVLSCHGSLPSGSVGFCPEGVTHC